jgi:hypothetical protein
VLTSLVKCSWLVLSVAKNGCIGVVVVVVLDITLNCCIIGVGEPLEIEEESVNLGVKVVVVSTRLLKLC